MINVHLMRKYYSLVSCKVEFKTSRDFGSTSHHMCARVLTCKLIRVSHTFETYVEFPLCGSDFGDFVE